MSEYKPLKVPPITHRKIQEIAKRQQRDMWVVVDRFANEWFKQDGTPFTDEAGKGEQSLVSSTPTAGESSQ